MRTSFVVTTAFAALLVAMTARAGESIPDMFDLCLDRNEPVYLSMAHSKKQESPKTYVFHFCYALYKKIDIRYCVPSHRKLVAAIAVAHGDDLQWMLKFLRENPDQGKSDGIDIRAVYEAGVLLLAEESDFLATPGNIESLMDKMLCY